MPDLLSKGASWLDGKRHAQVSRTITYERSADSVSLPATVGRTEFEQVDEEGIVQRMETRDYLIRASSLVLAGQTTVPKSGDIIEETESGVLFVYEVMAPGNEPPWRYSGPDRTVLRVHTKFIQREAA